MITNEVLKIADMIVGEFDKQIEKKERYGRKDLRVIIRDAKSVAMARYLIEKENNENELN